MIFIVCSAALLSAAASHLSSSIQSREQRACNRVHRATVQLQRSKTGFSKTGDRTCRNSLPFHCIMPKAPSPNFDVMCPDSFITESTINYPIFATNMGLGVEVICPNPLQDRMAARFK